MYWVFAKYVACGNDFILFDNRKPIFPYPKPKLIHKLCHRQWGVGGDGVILIESSTKADFRMRIFNSDGSEAEMCGNGLRCAVKWLATNQISLPIYQIEVSKEVWTAAIKDNDVCIEMKKLSDIQWNIPLHYESQPLFVHHINTGVPHTILFLKDLDNFTINPLGKYLRHHFLWQPKGTNVTFVEHLDQQKIKIRTFERGIEGETLACGTGSVAAALATAKLYHQKSPIRVQTRSGAELMVDFGLSTKDYFSQVTLTGPADCTFHGQVEIQESFPFSIACNQSMV